MMRKRQNRGTLLLLLTAWLMMSYTAMAQVDFKATAPSAVVQGEQFRLSYVLNQEGRDLRLPDLPDFEVLFGPSTSTSFSQRTVNGKTTSERSVTYTYILIANNTGTFAIPPATIRVEGSTYESNSLTVDVLPPDEASSRAPSGDQSPADSPSRAAPGCRHGMPLSGPSSLKTARTNKRGLQ